MRVVGFGGSGSASVLLLASLVLLTLLSTSRTIGMAGGGRDVAALLRGTGSHVVACRINSCQVVLGHVRLVCGIAVLMSGLLPASRRRLGLGLHHGLTHDVARLSVE
jgi:hypothetical protein